MAILFGRHLQSFWGLPMLYRISCIISLNETVRIYDKRRK